MEIFLIAALILAALFTAFLLRTTRTLLAHVFPDDKEMGNSVNCLLIAACTLINLSYIAFNFDLTLPSYKEPAEWVIHRLGGQLLCQGVFLLACIFLIGRFRSRPSAVNPADLHE